MKIALLTILSVALVSVAQAKEPAGPGELSNSLVDAVIPAEMAFVKGAIKFYAYKSQRSELDVLKQICNLSDIHKMNKEECDNLVKKAQELRDVGAAIDQMEHAGYDYLTLMAKGPAGWPTETLLEQLRKITYTKFTTLSKIGQ